MAKPKPFVLSCPCCQAELTVDPELEAVITFKAPEKPREISDIEAAMQIYKGEATRREDEHHRGGDIEEGPRQFRRRRAFLLR